MDADTRKLWKTFPWIGIGFTVFMGFLSIRSILSGSIRFEDSKSHEGPKYVSLEDNPFAYSMILLLLVAFSAAGLTYCVFRIRRRNRFRREDKESEKNDLQIP